MPVFAARSRIPFWKGKKHCPERNRYEAIDLRRTHDQRHVAERGSLHRQICASERDTRSALYGVILAQQPASSLSDLPQQAKQGDRIEVTLSDGTILKGGYESVTDSALRMRLSGRTRDISATTITGIRKRRPDSNIQGTLIGLAAGVGAGLVATSATCSPNDPECSTIAAVLFIPLFAAGGAGIGGMIDDFTHKYDPIYVSKITGGSRLRLSPIVSRDKKGIRLALSF